MKVFLFFLCFYLSVLYCSATEASKYVSNLYGKNSHIVVKKEHTQELFQHVGNKDISAITYGWGDLKVKGCKKCSISYVCILNKERKPIWGYVIPR